MNYLPWFAIVSATSWLIAVITISIYFAVGQPWGTVNDSASVVQWAAAIPLVLGVGMAQRGLGLVSLSVTVGGFASLWIASGLTLLLLARIADFAQVGTPTALAAGAYGLWLLLAAVMLAGRSSLPVPLIAIMAMAGLGTALGAFGFVGFGPSHWLTYAGGALGGILYPIWGYWLAYLMILSRDALAPTPS